MKPKSLRQSALLATALVVCHAAPCVHAASGNWINNTGNSNWSTTTNWSSNPTVPGTAAGDVVGISNNISAARTVTIDTTSRTVGTLNIGDPTTGYFGFTLAASGGASLIFDNSGSGALLAKTTSGNNALDTISAPVSLADNLTVDMTDTTANSFLRISSVISETGGARSITKDGSGILQLGPITTGAGPTNTFTGGFTLNAGEVHFSGNSVFGTGTLTVNSGTLSARGLSRTLANPVSVGGDFTLGGTAQGGNLLTLAGTVDLGGSTRAVSVAATGGAAIPGIISNGGVTKVGIGNLTLSGTNTYSGTTTVTAGTLALGPTGSIANSSSLVLNGGNFNVSAVGGGYALASGQTLSGNGGSVTGDLTVNGTLAIGSSPGTITFNNTLTLGVGSASNFEFTAASFAANSYDLAFGGVGSQTANFNGTLNLFFDAGETYLDNSAVKIFDFETYAGSFTSVNYTGLGAGQSALFDSATGFVTVVPEPGAAVLGGIGCLMLLRRRRR